MILIEKTDNNDILKNTDQVLNNTPAAEIWLSNAMKILNWEPWKFLNWHESRDKKYMVYEYTIQSSWTPNSIRYQAVQQKFAKSKDGIQITNQNAIEYDEKKIFSKWEKVYVRIPKINHINQKTTNNESKKTNDTGKTQVETTNEIPKWLRLENGTYIYKVQSWDTRNNLVKKLWKYKPLSYLNDGYWWAWDWSNSFNVWPYLPDHKFQAWVDLIVPNKPKYEKSISTFKKSQATAIENMKTNSKYWEKIKKLFKSTKNWWYGYSESHIINVMTAFARSESSREKLNDIIWECALFRYEPSQVFSYGYYHILYTWAWKKAFEWLNFKLWDSCNPIKSGMLFLAFIIEKRPNDYQKFFNMGDVARWAKMYNWWNYKTNKYDTKLKNNYNYIKNK